jgi:CheY-like chemotaxis protein
MLAFARRQDMKVTALHLPELVYGMSQLLESSIGSGIQIETHFPLGLPPAKGDGNQVELALLNLTVNARDAMADGGRITISARTEKLGSADTGLPPGDYVCLAVTDSGEGMDAETLAHAAEPFFTTKGVGRGTGLGLSMVHGVAAQSGGRLVLLSQKGKGTTAEIWLPVAGPELLAETKPESGPEAGPTHAPITVLVVDDDPLVLMNTAAMLDDLGHAVLEASSGAQALRILGRANNIDLVITDQVMPGMTGTQLITAIREQWPGMSVILATGYAELPAGTDPGLQKLAKPYQQATLARAIAERGAARAAEKVLRFPPRSKGSGADR